MSSVKNTAATSAPGSRWNASQSCLVAGIGETTLSRWRKEHSELEPRFDQGRETARMRALVRIRAAGEKDRRASEAWLRLSFPADYRGEANVRISATANAQQVVYVEIKSTLGQSSPSSSCAGPAAAVRERQNRHLHSSRR
jgi:hypothetical protein